MGTTIGIGNRVGVGSGVSWETYWLELSEVVEMLWVNKFDGDNLLSELDTNVITVTNKDFFNNIHTRNYKCYICNA